MVIRLSATPIVVVAEIVVIEMNLVRTGRSRNRIGSDPKLASTRNQKTLSARGSSITPIEIVPSI